jgi:two-component system response regulator YesN
MLTALLVDDEPYVLKALKTMIDWDSYGFSLLEASNGKDALEKVKTHNPDLIITDIKMPAMNGIEFIRLCLEKYHSLAEFVILSGYDDFSYAKEAMLYNVKDYLLKPVDDDDLNELVSRIAEQIREKNKKAENDCRKFSFILNQYLRRAIKGEKKPAVLKRISTLLNIGEEDDVICILIEIESANKDYLPGSDAKKRDAERKIIETWLGFPFLLHLFEDDMGRFGIMATEQMRLFHSIEPSIQELIKKLEKDAGRSVAATISSPGKGPRSFATIYKQALFSFSYKFFNDGNKIIHYQDVKNLTLNNKLYTNDFSTLLESVVGGRNHEIQSQVDQLFDNFSSGLRGPAAIIAYLKYFDCELIKLIMGMDCNQEEFSHTVLKFEKSIEHLTMSEIKNTFLAHCKDASDYIMSIRLSNLHSIILEMKNYINQNYKKNLKLKDIAQMFSMNSIYLGQLFHKSTGMKFTDYINSLRIEEAKKILASSDMNIQEIARAVGFRDARYFAVKFKAATNQTPSVFQTNHRNT